MPQKHPPSPPRPERLQIGDFLASLGGLFGSIMAIYAFYKAFREDIEGFIWLIPIGIIFWGVILWQQFQSRRESAYLLLGLTILSIPIIFFLWNTEIKEKQSKIIVLVAEFDGPEDKYGVRDELIEQLKTTTADYPNIEISAIDIIITSMQGSEYAQELGKRYQADIVIWAWYRPTENPNITIHVENLSPQDFSFIKESEVYRPDATIDDLESFEVQKKIGTETSNLVNFLAGYLQYQTNNYETALNYFIDVSDRGAEIPILNQKYFYLYTGNCYYYLDKFQEAIKEYDMAIYIDENDPVSFYNRGSAYGMLFQYEAAINDLTQAVALDQKYARAYNELGFYHQQLGLFIEAIDYLDKAIDIDPTMAYAYNNRGYSYMQLKRYSNAVRDFDMAIQLKPGFVSAYIWRGVAYGAIGEHEKAIKDLDLAIELDQSSSIAYNARGFSLGQIGRHKEAIKDFDEAIKLNPNFIQPYNGRGYSYYALEEFDLAIQDFDSAIRIDPTFPYPYYWRSMTYKLLGKHDEAEIDLAKYNEIMAIEKP